MNGQIDWERRGVLPIFKHSYNVVNIVSGIERRCSEKVRFRSVVSVITNSSRIGILSNCTDYQSRRLKSVAARQQKGPKDQVVRAPVEFDVNRDGEVIVLLVGELANARRVGGAFRTRLLDGALGLFRS